MGGFVLGFRRGCAHERFGVERARPSRLDVGWEVCLREVPQRETESNFLRRNSLVDLTSGTKNCHRYVQRREESSLIAQSKNKNS